ncbi:ATP-binding cassette domain-containing protein [Thermobaculum terrenum]|uniref:ATP-binding cassette domain-containing protein n=1 Tax=Thermobaculum terrenum TaxID=166501 RepID=UPI00019BF176|nr:ABC transporter ATP-binding protein [Thermobaculum terrenum]
MSLRGSMHQHLRGTATVLRDLWRAIALLVVPAPATAAVYLLLVLASGVLPVMGTWLLKLVLDRLGAAQYGAALLAALLYAVTLALPAVLDPVQRAVSAWLEARAIAEIDLRLMGAGMRLVDLVEAERPAFHDRLRMTQEMPGLLPRMIYDFRAVLGSLITLVGLLLLLASLHPLLPVVLAALAVPHMVLEERSTKLLYWAMAMHSRAAREMDYCLRVVTEPGSAKEVRVFGLGGFFLGRFRDRSRAALREMTRIRLRHMGLSVALNVLYALALGGGLWYVAAQAGSGRLTIGDVGLYVNSIVQAQRLLHLLPDSFRRAYQTLLYTWDFFALLNDAEPRIKLPEPGKGLPVPGRLREGIELRGVSFRYPESTTCVLWGVSFELPAGKVTALVGHNGAGKSTLVKLLTRMYDPIEGEILLDGVPIQEYDLEDLRGRIAVVYQDFARLALTLGENIAVGGGDPERVPPEQIARAAVWAGAEEIAERLPQGYETELTRRFEGGVELSWGQWQRVALARGYVRDGAVVILDEPTR